jgi:hypothetical protein
MMSHPTDLDVGLAGLEAIATFLLAEVSLHVDLFPRMFIAFGS